MFTGFRCVSNSSEVRRCFRSRHAQAGHKEETLHTRAKLQLPCISTAVVHLIDDEDAAGVEAEVALRGEPGLQPPQLRERAVGPAIDVGRPQARLCHVIMQTGQRLAAA